MTHPEVAVLAIATLDTKGDELQWVVQCLRTVGVPVRIVDVGSQGPPQIKPDTDRYEVLSGSGYSAEQVMSADRGGAVTMMGDALSRWVVQEHSRGAILGIIGIGGSGGTSIVTQAMRAMPVGLPKLMVSTVASGQVGPYVDCNDICMMYSVVDVAGLNAVSTQVLANAAHAMAGMVHWPIPKISVKPAVAMTMFGVTTPCVTAVRKSLEAEGYDCLVFHATGTGGRAMEKLVESGLVQGVLDITTTEVADEVVGGVFPAGPRRFDVTLQKRIPYVMSTGALDMVNFGARDTVPEHFRSRKLYVHNPMVTLMRTTVQENKTAAQWIASKINASNSRFSLLIPEGGVSSLDAPGMAFHDPEADSALNAELEARINQTPEKQVIRLPYHINAPEFADALVNEFLRLCRTTS
ncbi:MAG: Tm-1-like ATP-binding domain-containing protein [Planctomyces sp.]|nr:Tm-1-like ATP-binding domain-containing protein [Planctomyces sp.]